MATQYKVISDWLCLTTRQKTRKIESYRVHPTFSGAYVIPTQVGIHSGASCLLWIPVCTGMTD